MASATISSSPSALGPAALDVYARALAASAFVALATTAFPVPAATNPRTANAVEVSSSPAPRADGSAPWAVSWLLRYAPTLALVVVPHVGPVRRVRGPRTGIDPVNPMNA